MLLNCLYQKLIKQKLVLQSVINARKKLKKLKFVFHLKHHITTLSALKNLIFVKFLIRNFIKILFYIFYLSISGYELLNDKDKSLFDTFFPKIIKEYVNFRSFFLIKFFL